MNKLLLLCLVIGLPLLSVRAQYYITHINIVDVKNGTIAPDQTVCIDGNRIKSISSTPLEDTISRVYDGRGKYLMPGLWDMHIHDADDSATRFEYIPLFLANGVTGIRDMWGSEEMLRLRNDIDSGRFTGPRMVVGSPIIEGDKPFFRGTLMATTAMQGRRLVDSLSEAGYNFIKIYSLIRKPVYLAIADECKMRGVPLEGHLPIEVGLKEALDVGQRSFEHNFGVNDYLTGKEGGNVAWAFHYLDTVHSTRDGQFMAHGEPLEVTDKDFHLPKDVLNKMRTDRVAVVPTLTLYQGRSMSGEVMAPRTKGTQYLTEEFIQYWLHQFPVFPVSVVQSIGAATKFLMNKGVLILAGTDVNNPFCVPGFGLQQELINLHQAGLTNLQVLQTATINPALFLYLENDLGTVMTGKLADLLLLDDNPLTDISNTQKIMAVIVNGKYISRSDIAHMLDAQRKR